MLPDMPEATQASLTPDGVPLLETHGDPFRSWLQLSNTLVDECRLHFTGDKVWGQMVDPGNVGMLRTEWPADAFDTYNVEDETAEIGVNLNTLEKSAQFARKGRGDDDGDPVELDLNMDTRKLSFASEREDQGIAQQTEIYLIDPNSVRGEPTMPDLADEWDTMARVDVAPLREMIQQVDEFEDHIRFTARDGDLVIEGESDHADQAFTVSDAASPFRDNPAFGEPFDGSRALFSLDYVKDMLKGLDKAKIETTTLVWGDEFPIQFRYTHEEWGYTGAYMLAPRIQSD